MASVCRMNSLASRRAFNWVLSGTRPSSKRAGPSLTEIRRHSSATAFTRANPVDSNSSIEAQLQADLENDTSRGPSRLRKQPEIEANETPESQQVALAEEHAKLFSTHLNKLFPPLFFPPDLTTRILTHSSHPAAYSGHNGQLAFVGRRVLQSYLLLFLSSSSQLREEHDLDRIVSRALDARVLGEVLGVQRWGLAVAMRWTPSVPKSLMDTARQNGGQAGLESLLAQRGLYRVSGDAVEAVIGGIWKQFGASVAHRTFHLHVLPYLKVYIPKAFHEDVARLERDAETSGLLLEQPDQPAITSGNVNSYNDASDMRGKTVTARPSPSQQQQNQVRVHA